MTNNLRIMVGLPGLGKSSLAEVITRRETNTIVVSSDDLRATLLKDVYRQDENQFIFSIMKDVTINSLRAGKNVIYDATNINEDKRRKLVTEIKKEFEGLKVIGVYCVGNYQDAFKYNAVRARVVPNEVILKMTKTLDIPTKRDTDYLDEITYHSILRPEVTNLANILNAENYEEFNNLMDKHVNIYEHCIDLPQDCPYHTLSVSRHIYAAFEYAKKNMPDNLKGYHDEILFALAFHDIGKPICKEFRKKSRYANFICHEKVSAQIFLAEAFRYVNSRDKMNYEFITALIKEHSFPYEDKDVDAYINALDTMETIYGKDFRNCLEFVRKCDQSAH